MCGSALGRVAVADVQPATLPILVPIEHGGFSRRLGAWLIDTAILWAGLVVLTAVGFPSAFFGVVSRGGLVIFALPWLSTPIVGLGLIPLDLLGVVNGVFTKLGAGEFVVTALPGLYYVLLTGLKGGTVGKMAVGVVVINTDRRPPGLKSAILRETVGKLASTVPLLLGFMTIVWDPEKRAWHDKLAGTRVVKARR